MRAAGNSDFVDVEEAAVAWHRNQIENGIMEWHSRRSPYPFGHPSIESNEALIQAFPITTYLRYLIEFRSDATQSELSELVTFLQDEGRIETTGTFAPSVIGYEPRQSSSDTAAPMSTATAQLALVNVMAQQRFGTSFGPSAESLIGAILSVQEPDTGLIDHLGRDLPGYDFSLVERMAADSHPYAGLKALLPA